MMGSILEAFCVAPLLAVSWHLACAHCLTAWCDLLLGE
jgi:hypothetical protein